MAQWLKFTYHNEAKTSGVIECGDVKISFRKFPTWNVNPVETRESYIRELIANPTCDVRTGVSKFMGWEFRFHNVKKFIVRTDCGLSMFRGFSVKQLREAADLKRSDKVMKAPKGW